MTLIDGVRLFKVLNPDGSPSHGGNPKFRWPLPTDGAPGKWIEVKGKTLRLCEHPGLHLTRNPAHWYQESAIVCEAEYDGEILDGNSPDGKVSVRRARLLRIVAWDDAGVFTRGEHALYDNAQVTLYDNAQATLYDNAQVTLYGHTQATLYGNANATLYGNASATLTDNANATLYGNASATLTDNASATLFGYASATLYGNASATLYGNASATLYDNASATLFGYAQATLYDNAHATLSGNASATLYGNANATLSGTAQATSDRWHIPSATVMLEQMAVHIDRRGGKLIIRTAAGEWDGTAS